jgi:hypothetical protein
MTAKGFASIADGHAPDAILENKSVDSEDFHPAVARHDAVSS